MFEEHKDCHCRFPVVDYPSAFHVDTGSQNEQLRATKTVIFEACPVNSLFKKVLKISNDSTEIEKFSVTRDPSSNPIYHVFDVKLESRLDNCLELLVTFSPQVPNQHYADYFYISSNAFNRYKICVKGHSIGPSLKASTDTLLFYNTKSGSCFYNTFELTNTSDQEVYYQFDVNENDEDQNIFKIDHVRGRLSPRDHTYISVKFRPRGPRIYALNLPCRILNHPPIMIQLLGVVQPTLNTNPLQFNLKQFSDKYPMHGYEAYMYDTVNKVIQKPPFSLSVTYLDFGTVEFDEMKNASRSLVTSLTNHLDCSIEVVWMNDNDRVFSISPKTALIPPDESVMYECSFKPDCADFIFSKLLTGCVYWSAIFEDLQIPLDVTLKLLGNSFFKNKIWLPRVEVQPNVVIMPPTTPTLQSYATIIMKSSGHLPTSYKFLPPKKSNFVLKPMEGLICTFEIIVIQLHPDASDKKAYVERWGLELNGRKEEYTPLFLKGYAERATLVLGNDNFINFQTTHPGSQDILKITLKNPTIHSVMYNFEFNGTTRFAVNRPIGELVSNEAISLEWHCTGSLTEPSQSKISCKVSRIKDLNIISDLPSIVPIMISTKCAYTELCATPNIWEFNQVEMGTTVSTSFYFFNFGLAPIHFQLLQKKSELPTSELTITPTKGTVNPNEKVQVIVSVKGTVLGVQEMQIVYKVRLNMFSDVIVNSDVEHNVFLVRLFCLYPTIQIEDITCHNYGFLFSRRALWSMFNIDELNDSLQTIQRDETQTIEMYTPDYEIGENCYHATLNVRNTTNFSNEVKLKRQKNCDCKIVQKSKGMSIRQYVHDCIHRKMAKLSFDSEVMEGNLNYNMQLDVRYLTHGLAKMVYIMTLSYNRTIIININVNVLPKVVTMPSKYFNSFDLDLLPTYIGLMDPPAQVFPLYNNSKFPVHYEVDIVPLSRVNFEYRFDVFTCINPKGTLEAFTFRNLIFKFQPITTEEYKVVVPIQLGEKVCFVHLRGTGVIKFTKYLSAENYAPKPLRRNVYNPIEISSDHLVFEPFPIWSFNEKLVFISNKTSDRVIGYSFLSCVEEGVVLVEAQHPKGVLQPKESHPVVIYVRSYNQPCILHLQMVCRLLDHSQHIRHVESVIEYKNMEEKLMGQFTITEEGVYFPVNDVKVQPEVKPFFTTLSMKICIVSIRDREVCFTVEEQFSQPPQSRLYIDSAAIFIDYAASIVTQESDETLHKTFKGTALKKSLDDCNVDIIKFTIDCLMADTLLSKIFNELIWFGNHLQNKYYMQFVVNEELNKPNIKKSALKAKHKKGLKNHLELVKSYLQAPQGPVVQSVFSQLLLDSIHEVFKLGPPKHKTNKQEQVRTAEMEKVEK